MLKYFGLKEILYGLKKFALFVIAVTLLFAAFGYILNSGDSDVIVVDDEVFSSSYSYVFTAEKDGSEKTQKDGDRACAVSAAAMLRADFCKDYVYKKLLEQYSVEEILEYTATPLNADNISHLVLDECFEADVINDTSIVNFYSVVRNEEFAKNVANHLNDYLVNTIVKQVPNLASYEYAGSTTVSLPLGMTEDKYVVSAPSGNKGVIILAILGFVAAVCAVLVYVLFKPSVAAKKDFEEYGLTVLDEMRAHGKNADAFAADILKKELNEAKVSKLAVVSTVTERPVRVACGAVADAVAEMSDGAITVKTVANIVSDFAHFEQIKPCNGVVLIEKKGSTLHGNLENTLDLLKKYDLPIIGVILV